MSSSEISLAGQQPLWLLALFGCWAACKPAECMEAVMWCAFGAHLSH